MSEVGEYIVTPKGLGLAIKEVKGGWINEAKFLFFLIFIIISQKWSVNSVIIFLPLHNYTTL